MNNFIDLLKKYYSTSSIDTKIHELTYDSTINLCEYYNFEFVSISQVKINNKKTTHVPPSQSTLTFKYEVSNILEDATIPLKNLDFEQISIY